MAAKKNVVKMPAAKPPTPATGDLPGVEGPGVAPKSIPEVEELADKYVVARDARMRATDKEVDAKTKLADSLHKHAEEIGKNEAGEIKYRVSRRGKRPARHHTEAVGRKAKRQGR